MNRRGFLATLAALPFVGKLVPQEKPGQLVRRNFECPLCSVVFREDVRNPVGRLRLCPGCWLAAREPNELLQELEFKPAPPGPYRYEPRTKLPKIKIRMVKPWQE